MRTYKTWWHIRKGGNEIIQMYDTCGTHKTRRLIQQNPARVGHIQPELLGFESTL